MLSIPAMLKVGLHAHAANRLLMTSSIPFLPEVFVPIVDCIRIVIIKVVIIPSTVGVVSRGCSYKEIEILNM
jgi:hypothetical protein